MHIFFLFLATLTLSLFGTSVYFAWQNNFTLHAFFGLITTLSCLITHCWVFFYFIGTGEGIREGILDNKLDLAAIKRTKKFKAKTFPFALFSMIFMIVATILGAGAQVGKVSAGWHKGLVYFALLFNLFSFFQEFKIIKDNRELMENLNKQIVDNKV